jgi:hypothetical protein
MGPIDRTVTQIVLLVVMGAPGFAADPPRVEGKNIRIEFDGTMHSRVVASLAGQERVVGDFAASEFIRVSGRDGPTSPCKTRHTSASGTVWVQVPGRPLPAHLPQ